MTDMAGIYRRWMGVPGSWDMGGARIWLAEEKLKEENLDFIKVSNLKFFTWFPKIKIVSNF